MLQIVCSKNQEVLDVLSESKMRAHKMQANSVAGEMVCRVHACICLGVHMTGLDFSLPFGVCLVIHRQHPDASYDLEHKLISFITL